MLLSVVKNKYLEAKKLANKKKKKLAFLIGNTIKSNKSNYYFTPPRITDKLVVFGIVVFDESIATNVCKFLDGKVDIIFADAEKKIFPKKDGTLGNIERSVREEIKKSKIYIYKGNDLSVDSVDLIEVIKKVEDSISKFRPNTIITHHQNDLNIDHQLINQAVLVACRPQNSCSVKKQTNYTHEQNMMFVNTKKRYNASITELA